MPRPKGSKNKKTTITVIENIDDKIAVAEAAVSSLTEELKAKKKELKDLLRAKEQAAVLAAEKKAEEDKAKLLDAVAASGKSIDDIISLLQEK